MTWEQNRQFEHGTGGREGWREGRREREGVVWWWNHTHELPTKREGLLVSLSQFVPCCSIFAARSDCRTSLLKRKHNNVISWVHITYSQYTLLHQPAIGRQQQSGRCPTLHFSMWAATMCTSMLWGVISVKITDLHFLKLCVNITDIIKVSVT